MFCKYCGTELPDGTTTCTNCGKVLNKGAETAKMLREKGTKLQEKGKKLREPGTENGIRQTERTSRDPLRAFGFALAAVVLGIAFVRLSVAGSQLQGLAAIIAAVMAMTGNRKLVPYISILEMLVDGFGVLTGIAAGIFGASTAYGILTMLLIYLVELGGDYLYISALFKGEKGQPCSWRYLPVVILVVMHCFTAIAGPKVVFLAPVIALIVNLPFAAYRFFMIRWMFDRAEGE